MVYRPTVRYADVYKKYIDDLFQATTLDRNQIIRAALFTSIFSGEFKKLIAAYKRKDVPLPSPLWSLNQSELWLKQNPTTSTGGRDVDAAKNIGEAKEVRSEEQTVRSEKEVPERRKNLQPEDEKRGRQTEERRNKKEALDTPRAQQGPIRKVHSNDKGGIVIRIG